MSRYVEFIEIMFYNWVIFIQSEKGEWHVQKPNSPLEAQTYKYHLPCGAKIKNARQGKYICISIVDVQKCGMATLDVNDLKAIKDLIEVTVEEVIDKKGLATRDHLGNLPTKDEFYGKMDQVMEELRAIR